VSCPDVAAGCHLTLRFNDIVAPTAGLVLPDESLIQSILSFAEDWRGERPLFVHCFAGVSRSTAAAYIIACRYMPEGEEENLATKLREAAPFATPNALMVALADKVLGRRGRMVEAVRGIGRGADAFEGAAFAFADVRGKP
jgi:predicted protein tyrosine phosphatase